MDLYKELLVNLLSQERVQVTFPGFPADTETLLELHCYQMLKKIKAVVDDGSLDDATCFRKIEEILVVLEDNGISVSRHDFG